MNLVKSKERVADRGEVFTPSWMVEAMLDLVKDETERIDSQFLEPACGSGNFLVRVLRRKLVAVERKFGKSDFERRHYSLFALMCIYGIELLADNIAECRANMLEILAEYLKLDEPDDLYRAAFYVLSQNLVHGDALTMRTHDCQAIAFAEWGYLGKGKFQRRDFRFDILTHSSAFSSDGSLFADLGKHDVFTPVKTYPPMTLSELAAATHGEGLPPARAAEGIQHRTDESGGLRVPAVRRRVAPLHRRRQPRGAEPLRALRHRGGERVDYGHAKLRAVNGAKTDPTERLANRR